MAHIQAATAVDRPASIGSNIGETRGFQETVSNGLQVDANTSWLFRISRRGGLGGLNCMKFVPVLCR